MKILVGNNGLNKPGGSETYTYALISQLVKMGHTVHAIGKIGPGIVSDKLKEIGVQSFFKPIKGDYDLILLSHSSSIDLAKNASGFKIQTCHGVYPKLEQPVPGMDAYVSISEEVHEHLTKLGYKSTIIRNRIDCDRYKPEKPISKNLKTVLSLAHSDAANEVIKAACKIAGVDLIINNKYKEFKWDVEHIINKADLVISLGRGAYESMAAGRNVVIFDKRNYVNMPAVGDGIITKENVNDYLKNNCSGRYSKKEFNAKLLSEELKKYNIKNGDDLRQYAIEHLNIEKQVKKYLEIYENSRNHKNTK